MRKLVAVLASALCAGGAIAAVAIAQGDDATDPARNVALPCEAVSAESAQVPRAAKNFAHVANVCELVGTDMEFQSRRTANGNVHDYAFVGTMGAGFRIFDVTDPARPIHVGGYADPGWQNDIQVRGNVAVATFDGVSGEDSSGSTCLKAKGAGGQGVDIYRLAFAADDGRFDVSLATCVANPPGGAHNSTLSPNGKWLAISNCCSDWAVDVVDLRNLADDKAVHRYRLIDEGRADATRCPSGAAFKCIVIKLPNGKSARGLWRPHDVHFSRDGSTMYVAAINSTWVVNVAEVLKGNVKPLAMIPNITEDGGIDNPENVSISHQADVTPDGKILVVSDERGGGLSELGCNTGAGGVIGGLHFFALGEVNGVSKTQNASPKNPVKLGDYFTPNPAMTYDPLAAALPRTERGCTIHVFRIGGNGTSSPGENADGFGGVSGLSNRRLVSAHYGAGTWHIDIAGPSSSTDGIAEDPRSTWGNTKGWIVMPGADTWSAKEYKGRVYAGDMARGFDVFRFDDCAGAACAAGS
jgi:hypothetical protein